MLKLVKVVESPKKRKNELTEIKLLHRFFGQAFLFQQNIITRTSGFSWTFLQFSLHNDMKRKLAYLSLIYFFAVVLANKVLFHFQSSNDTDGIESFVNHLKTACPQSNLQNSLYCMENTGIHNNHLLKYLNSKKSNVWVEHPVTIKEILGMIRGKNDKVDAKRIAFYA